MKQYTDKDQTAKLIELGFPKPTRIVAIGGFPPKDTLARYASYKDDFDSVTCYEGYSIGELIEFLPEEIIDEHSEVSSLEFSKMDVYYANLMGMSYYTNGAELIDALFNMCVTLKEEGVI